MRVRTRDTRQGGYTCSVRDPLDYAGPPRDDRAPAGPDRNRLTVLEIVLFTLWAVMILGLVVAGFAAHFTR